MKYGFYLAPSGIVWIKEKHALHMYVWCKVIIICQDTVCWMGEHHTCMINCEEKAVKSIPQSGVNMFY